MITDVWNSLPRPLSLINCETIATFKKHLDCLLKNLRQHYFSERVINTWIKLDSDIVCSSIVIAEKLQDCIKMSHLLDCSGLLILTPEADPVPHGETSSGKLSGKLSTRRNQMIWLFYVSLNNGPVCELWEKSKGGSTNEAPKAPKNLWVILIERRRREDRGAEWVGCGRGCPPPHWGRSLGGYAPSAENFLTLELKMAGFGAFWVLFLPLQLPVGSRPYISLEPCHMRFRMMPSICRFFAHVQAASPLPTS